MKALFTRRHRSILRHPVLLLAAVAVFQARAAAGDELQALAGAQSHDKGKQVLAFLPNEL